MTRWNGILLRVHREDGSAAQLSKHSMAYPLETRLFIFKKKKIKRESEKIEER